MGSSLYHILVMWQIRGGVSVLGVSFSSGKKESMSSRMIGTKV